jgi:hypothetical protein
MDVNSDSEYRKEEKNVRQSIEWLFSTYIESDPQRDLEAISRYLKFLGDGIEYRRMRVEFEPDLLESFEAVEMLIYDRLKFYPESLSIQIKAILQEDKVAQTLGLLANLSERDRIYTRYAGGFMHALSRFGGMFYGRSFTLIQDFGISQEGMLKTKVALKRASQLLKYAATLNVLGSYSEFRDFREHFNPDLVNRNKVVALINLLKVDLRQLPESDFKKSILSQLDDIDREAQKKSPRWGPIIAGLFILVGVLADAKTLNPHVYDRSLDILNSILHIIQEEGMVSRSRESQNLPFPGSDESSRPPASLPPPRGVQLENLEEEP